MSVSISELGVGSLVGGEFELVRPLAQGGMGVVYVARQQGTGALRALKVMAASLAQDERLRRRFVQEARVTSQLRSDHVVQVIAAGVDEKRGFPWLAMELLEGMDLRHYLQNRGALAHPEAAEVLAQVCHALVAAHSAGIVHRDLKAENVFLASARLLGMSSIVKLLDFGIARTVAEARGATGALGTPLCMAPEQAYGDSRVGPATDVWAFGLLTFQLLTGHHFWVTAEDADGGSPAAVLREVLFDPLPAASERAERWLCADRLPAGFDAWFARCVARDPLARFEDIGATWYALHSMLSPGSTPHSLSTAAPLDGGASLLGGSARSVAFQLSASLAPTPTGALTPARTAPGVRVTFRERFGRTVVESPQGTSLLDVSLSHGLPHFHACGGRARCSTCRVVVLQGEQNLGPRTEAEEGVAKRKGWPDNVRLACQSRVQGDVVVRRLVVDDEDAGNVLAEPAQESSGTVLVERPTVVLHATLRNFRAFSSSNLPFDVAHVLQRALRTLGEPISANHGRIERFDGESLVALFSAREGGSAEAAMDALRAALRMQMRVRQLNEYMGKHYASAFEMGAGMHAGEVLSGEVSVGGRTLPVMTGEAFQIAAEVEQIARVAGARLAVSEGVRALLGDAATLGRGLAPLVTAQGPLEVHEVLEFARPDSVFIVQSTFEQLAARADELADAFYARLFALAPAARPLFAHVDMAAQRTMLMGMLATAVRGLGDPGSLAPALRDLGRRHVAYGARTPHYRLVGQALLETLGEFLGHAWTPEVELSWRELYGLLARTMIDGTRAAPAA